MTRAAPFRAHILALLADGGHTDREIARRVGCDRSWVTMIRVAAGIAPVPPAYRGAIDPAQLDALLAAGMTRRQAARSLGVRPGAVATHLWRRKQAGAVSSAGPVNPGPFKHSSPTTETELLHSLQVQP